jgi:hypothetical protein
MSDAYRVWKGRMAARCSSTGKASFKSTSAARQFMDSRDHWNGNFARVYRCAHCDWIHLTSQRTHFDLRRTAAA